MTGGFGPISQNIFKCLYNALMEYQCPVTGQVMFGSTLNIFFLYILQCDKRIPQN